MDKERAQTDEADVVLFGKEVSGKNRAPCNDGGGVVWGVVLVFAGIVLLFNTLSVIPWEIWERLLIYWPALLILGGLHIIMGNSLLSRLLLTLFSIVILGTVCLLAIRLYGPDLVSALPPPATEFLNTVEKFLNKP